MAVHLTLAAAFAVGLLQGSLHCAGMCGPFVLAFGLAGAPAGPGRPRPRAATAPHLWHNAGRIAAFGLLGAAFGGLGGFVDDAARLTGLQAAAGCAGGLAMVLWAVDQARTGRGGRSAEALSAWRWAPLQTRLRGLFGRRDPAGAFACGLLLGLHPCGLLYALLLGAAATGRAATGAAVMVAFGLGTVPALLGLAAAGAYGAARLRGRLFSYGSAALVGASGLLFALRGLAVNGWVPHLWPWLF